jgi:nigerose phosphorylase
MTESATTPDSSEWILSTGEWDPETVTHNGNRFLLGNGAMGYRGTLEEFGPEEKVGILVSGLFDRVGDAWREPVNAPNPLFLRISADGTLLNPLSTAPDSHEQALNLLQAIHQRRTSFSVGQLQVAFTTERFLSAATTQLLALRCRIEIEGEGELVIESGIDDRIWDLNGPHLEDFRRTEEAGLSLLTARTHEAGKELAVAERARLVEDTTEIKGEIVDGLHCWTLPVSGSRTLVLEKIAAVCTPLDFPDSDVADNALQIVTQASDLGYDALCKLHADVWEARWQRADVRLEGDPEGQLALRYSLYQLISAAPFHSADLSIPARALSGQVYKGAVFWDTELFMLPFFLSTFPEVAHNLVAYRIRTLSGAKEKAREYGFKGAFYAWEGQEGGYDACTLFNVTDVFTQRPMRTYFRDKQIHISADVAWALWQTVSVTGDLDLLWDGGFEVLLECVRFLYSYAYRRSDNSEFVLCDVTGPDEYHERVNNNAYTNYMTQSAAAGLFAALECLRTAEEGRLEKLLMELGATPSELTALRDFRDRLYLPQPNEATRLIEQFDGYFALEDCSLAELKSRILEPTEYLGGGNGLATTTRILKQADVVLLLHLFADRFTEKREGAQLGLLRAENRAWIKPQCLCLCPCCHSHRPPRICLSLFPENSAD